MNHPDHVLKNRVAWTGLSASFEAPGRRCWASDEITWGIWNVRESDLHVLGDLAQWTGKDAVELGCGTAYFSGWLARLLHMHPVGVDITPAQLERARAFQTEFGVEFPLVEASAEDVPLPSESFDLALSEYGASIWCDPNRWIAEASRLLRPGGWLVFLRNSTLSMLCTPADGSAETSLLNDYARLQQMEFEGAVEFHMPHGELIRLLRHHGFWVENLIEVFPPADAPETRFDYISQAWARRWPSEEIWVARKLAPTR